MERHPYLREAPPPPTRQPTMWPYYVVIGILAGSALFAWFTLNFIPAVVLTLATWTMFEIYLRVKGDS